MRENTANKVKVLSLVLGTRCTVTWEHGVPLQYRIQDNPQTKGLFGKRIPAKIGLRKNMARVQKSPANKGLFCKRALVMWDEKHRATMTGNWSAAPLSPPRLLFKSGCCRVLQVFACCRVLLCIAVCRNTQQTLSLDLLSNSATHCKTLQDTARHCKTLQDTARHCSILQHTATHCNTLRHTATHCNTLQQRERYHRVKHVTCLVHTCGLTHSYVASLRMYAEMHCVCDMTHCGVCVLRRKCVCSMTLSAAMLNAASMHRC